MAFKISINKAVPTWDTLPVANLTYFPFEKGDYKPFTHTRMYVRDNTVHVQFICFEVTVAAEYLSPCKEMLSDSCITLQINPAAHTTEKYLSVTCNEKGTVMAMVCNKNEQVSFEDAGLSAPSVKVLHGGDNMGVFWGCEYALPAKDLQKVYGEISLAQGHTIYGNILKTRFTKEKPHFGSFFVYKEDHPDLFSPQSFGEFVLVNY